MIAALIVTALIVTALVLSLVVYMGYFSCELKDDCMRKRMQFLLDAHMKEFKDAPWWHKPAFWLYNTKCSKEIEEWKKAAKEGADDAPAADAAADAKKEDDKKKK